MNSTGEYVIRRAFLLPLGLLLLLTLVLLGVCIAQGQPTGKVIILAVIILPVAVLFAESASRRTRVDEQGVRVKKLLRQKRIGFDEVEAVDMVVVRKRAFLTLSSAEDFLILSNAYRDFPALVENVMQRVPEQAISEETRQLAAAPPVKSSDIVSCWFAVALMVLILIMQF